VKALLSAGAGPHKCSCTNGGVPRYGSPVWGELPGKGRKVVERITAHP